MKGLLVLAAALVLAPSAAAGGFYEAKVLEPAASFVAKKPVKVWCANTASAWVRFASDRSETHGLTVPGASVTHFDSQTCPPLRQAIRGGAAYLPVLAATIEVFTHEAIHMRGEFDEGVTDCTAVHEMPRVAVKFFHVKHLHALMAAAWVWRDELPPPYLSVC